MYFSMKMSLNIQFLMLIIALIINLVRGGPYNWVVPVGVTNLQVTAQGASGGSCAGLSGHGAIVTVTLSASPGSTLSIYVGGQGAANSLGSGGANGGGRGTLYATCNAGGGGGTDIRTAGTLSSRVIVAGDGGGDSCVGSAGGNGGNPTGGSASGGPSFDSTYIFAGGGYLSGGTGGSVSGAQFGLAGSSGQGGNSFQTSGCSGGGGGGYFGGGGGGLNTGGGGGSSYCDTSSCISPVYSIATSYGDGIVTISYGNTVEPTFDPSLIPTTLAPALSTQMPAILYSYKPTRSPAATPTVPPIMDPSQSPTIIPFCGITIFPTRRPTIPTNVPSLSSTATPSCNPTYEPTRSPSMFPSSFPSIKPSIQPSIQPSTQPTAQSLSKPTSQPTCQPVKAPSTQPWVWPSKQPTIQPANQPSGLPFSHPSEQPSSTPTLQLITRPSLQPSMQPSSNPFQKPTNKPTIQPSIQPTLQPSAYPSQPSSQPSCQPKKVPSTQPWKLPSSQPSSLPSKQPSSIPSEQPTLQPSAQPHTVPSFRPTKQPTLQPAKEPSAQPSEQPIMRPTSEPSQQPSRQPSSCPSVSPTLQSSEQPSPGPTAQPFAVPSVQPFASPSSKPSNQPSLQSSTQPSCQPITHPSLIPSLDPSTQPVSQPTTQPFSLPSPQSTSKPSSQPTFLPIVQPTVLPTTKPTRKPSSQPLEMPSMLPSTQPSIQPSTQPSKPSVQPTNQPTLQPVMQPSLQPSSKPSKEPSLPPTGQTTKFPTFQPLSQPSSQPSNRPFIRPSAQPVKMPSGQPLFRPSFLPSRIPSCSPSKQPYSEPTRKPAVAPNFQPSKQPFIRPSAQPFTQPSRHPLLRPSSQPSRIPSSQPSKQPVLFPLSQPTFQPSIQPWTFPTRSPSTQSRKFPSDQPTMQPLLVDPTIRPTTQPLFRPSVSPSSYPSSHPSQEPSRFPTNRPHFQPTQQPNQQPSVKLSAPPTGQPSANPTSQPFIAPTMQPSCRPTKQSLGYPSAQPGFDPSKQPTHQPGAMPSRQPSRQPTTQPFKVPTKQPMQQPSKQPSKQPMLTPKISSRISPAEQPSLQPRSYPSRQPHSVPRLQPCRGPSKQPSSQPSLNPSSHPSIYPSKQPKQPPSFQPFHQPTCQPHGSRPSKQPTSRQTHQSSCQPSWQPVPHPFIRVQLLKTESPIKIIPKEVAAIISKNDLSYFNINSQLILSGTIFSYRQCMTSWSIKNSTINIASNSLDSGIISVMPTQWAAATLVLKASVLGSHGVYRFELRCGNLNSSVVVIVNLPPRGGSMRVSPSLGYEVQTSFLFKALDWKDQDLPLRYQFTYFTAQNYQLTIGSSSQNSDVANALLPAGSGGAHFAINCSVQVFDFFAASTVSSRAVVVRPVSRAASRQFIISAINSSSKGLSLGTVNLLGTLLNKANCSGTPKCATLYRSSCSTVERTCGSCLRGFLGESGSHNSPCISPNSIVGLNQSLLAQQKYCLKNCSSRGECAYVNTVNGQKQSSCELISTTCQAVCVCRVGYAGASCSYTTAELQQAQKIRETLFTSILNLTQQSSSAAITSALASSLSVQTINIDEINYKSIWSVINIVNLLITQAAMFKVDQKDISQQILTSLDAAAGSQSIVNLIQALQNYVLYVSSQLYSSQDSVENILSNFKISVNGLSSSLISVPLSPLESFTGVAASAMDVSELFLGDFALIQATRVAIVELKATLFASNGSFVSNPLIITQSIVQSENVTLSPNQRRFIIISLVHHTPVNFQDHAVNFSTVCHRRQNSFQHRYVCPSSGYVVVHTCANKIGVLTTSCPRYQPSCGSLTDTNHSLCQLVSFSMNITVCNCSFSEVSSGHRRRLDRNIAESTVIQIVATGHYLVNQVAETLSASPSLASTDAIEHVYIVISTFSSLWVIGVVLLLIGRRVRTCERDTKEEKAGKVNPNLENIREDVAAYIAEVVPVIFRGELNSWKTLFDVFRHHKYVSLLNIEKIDSLLVSRVVTVQSMLMFILAVTYDLQSPADDETCAHWLTEQDCLSRKSYLDATQSYCQWSMLVTDDFGSSISGNVCSYQEPSPTVQEVLTISVLVSLVTALFLRPVEYLFKVLSAPIANRIKVNPSLLPEKKLRIGRSSESALFTELVKNHHVSKVAGVKVRDISKSAITARSVATKSVHRFTHITSSDTREQKDPDGALIKTASQPFSRARRQSRVERGFLLTDESFSKAALEVHLVTSIGRSRRDLPSAMLDEFDSQWGIQRNSDAVLSRTQSSDLSEVLFIAGMFDKIYQSVESVRRRVISKIDILRVTTEEQKGLEIFHLFIVDILGRDSPAATIFESKLGEDFEETKVVKYNRKIAAAAMLVMLNILFAYYSILYGSIRGQSWQMIYLSACVAQFFIEVFINETLETVWLHYMVPMMAAKEVVAAHRVLVDLVETFCKADVQSSSAPRMGGPFNSPDYLFVSTNVARAFPLLMESLIVQSYVTPLPGESARQWHQSRWERFWSRIQTPRRGNVLVRYAASTLLTALVLLEYGVTAPYLLQKMFVRSCQPFLVSSIVLAFYLVIKSPLYIALFFMSGAVVVVYMNRRSLSKLFAKRLSVVAPLPSSSFAVDPVEFALYRVSSEEEFSINFSISSESISLKEEEDSSRSSSVVSPLNTSEEGSFYSSLPHSSAGTVDKNGSLSQLLVSDNEY